MRQLISVARFLISPWSLPFGAGRVHRASNLPSTRELSSARCSTICTSFRLASSSSLNFFMTSSASAPDNHETPPKPRPCPAGPLASPPRFVPPGSLPQSLWSTSKAPQGPHRLRLALSVLQDLPKPRNVLTSEPPEPHTLTHPRHPSWCLCWTPSGADNRPHALKSASLRRILASWQHKSAQAVEAPTWVRLHWLASRSTCHAS